VLAISIFGLLIYIARLGNGCIKYTLTRLHTVSAYSIKDTFTLEVHKGNRSTKDINTETCMKNSLSIPRIQFRERIDVGKTGRNVRLIIGREVAEK
jgi:hypothetical protein